MSSPKISPQGAERLVEVTISDARYQSVIAGQWPDLDLDLVTLAALLVLAFQPGLMRGIDDRLPAGEHPAMAAGELAGV
ncbi:MAG: hypothetical protein WBQ18_15615 [Solirubrobacteraceae bacterium]